MVAPLKIAFVCTSYEHPQVTRSAVESLSSCVPQARIVVVDNASGSNTVRHLRALEAQFGNVTLIASDRNLGYFRGLNVGMRFLRGNFPDVTHVVVGNNDLTFPATFADDLRRSERSLLEHAVVSPNIVTVDGCHQNPHVVDKIGIVREMIYDVYHTHYALALAVKYLAGITKQISDRKDESRWQVPGPIYQGHGSCYILGPQFFHRFDELWAPTFLMGEEYFLSRQLSDVGLRVYYEPAISVIHQTHSTIGSMPNREKWRIARDAHKVYRRYVGVFGPRVHVE